jgi:hypothetical protein
MPIISTDIQYRLSGGAANSSDEASLGGIKSSTTISGTVLDDTSGAESLAGDVEYRCIYVHNNHGTLQLTNPVIWLQAQTLGSGHVIAIGVGSAAVNGTEQTVADESTAPAGVTFSAPTTQGTGLALGSIPAGQHKALWIRRTVTGGAAASNNGYTLRVTGETAA